jgi:hypothetical protein
MEEEVKVTGAAAAATIFLKRNIVKPFVNCYIFTQSLPGQHPTDKYPVNILHRF